MVGEVSVGLFVVDTLAIPLKGRPPVGALTDKGQGGKRNVAIIAVAPVGNYAVKPMFSDGHDSGIYTWDYLHWLGANREALWEDYLQRLEKAGYTRESGRDATVVAPNKTGCASH